MKRRQLGLTTTEFAIVGPAALLILFGCIEVGRMLFVWNTAVEATRRGARIAAVVTPDATGLATIQNAVTSFGNVAEVQAANVSVTYYDDTGAATVVSDNIAYVTVQVTPDSVTHNFMFGLFGMRGPKLPSFSTTLPVESKGFDPD